MPSTHITTVKLIEGLPIWHGPLINIYFHVCI